MRPFRPVVVLLAALLVAACGGDEPQDVPSETATPVPSPTETAEPSPSPSPSPTPEGVEAPLSGEYVDEEDAARPALAVKIENTTAAQPQAGLEDADLVIEELVEGGFTRFMAVFQSTVPELIGPIRSARLVDAELLPAFDGGLLYSGGRPDVEAAVRGTAVRLTEGDPGVYRLAGRRAPSNLFADGVAVYETLLDRDPELGPPRSGFSFADDAPEGACDDCDGTDVEVAFSNARYAGWAYDPVEGVYRRSQNGTPQPTASGDLVGAANVVVVGVTTYRGGCCDTAGSPYIVSDTTGEGRAIVLRDGLWYEARWLRPTADSPWRLVDEDGADVPLRRGPTWLHLVPEGRLPVAGGAAEGAEDAGGA